MKQIFVMFALLLGVCAANAQTTDTVKYAAGNDLYRGITRKLPYRQMVTPYGVEVTFAKTVSYTHLVPAECPIRYTRADESCRPQKTPPLHYQPKGDTPTVQLLSLIHIL